jgi:hypothetical protein
MAQHVLDGLVLLEILRRLQLSDDLGVLPHSSATKQQALIQDVAVANISGGNGNSYSKNFRRWITTKAFTVRM